MKKRLKQLECEYEYTLQYRDLLLNSKSNNHKAIEANKVLKRLHNEMNELRNEIIMNSTEAISIIQ